MPLDPTNFKVVGDYLLLFHRNGEADGLKMWNQSPVDEQTQLERADYYYKLFEF